MNSALFSKMTVTRFSLVFSGCLVFLLSWGCKAVICQVSHNVTEQPGTTTRVTTAGYNATQARGNESFGNQLQVSCLDSCKVFCIICEEYGKDSMECLSFIIAHYCLANFNEEMKSQNMDDWCNWDKVSWYYSAFSNCTEEHSECLLIPWPNSLVESFFVSIHSEFFQNCSTEEFSDPPPAVVFTLVITPICLIPVMVSLVVLKTKNGDGTS